MSRLRLPTSAHTHTNWFGLNKHAVSIAKLRSSQVKRQPYLSIASEGWRSL